MPTKRFVLLSSMVFFMAACAQSRPPGEAPDVDASPEAPSAPWTQASLKASLVPDPYLEVWEEAENQTTCALVVPSSVGEGQEGVPRSAQFAGGWGVAYDLPELRSAYGVAGTGAAADGFTYPDFPHEIRWSDGSVAEYGLEGGTGPNELAYLRIAGQGCLYNVWSRLGTDHLEHLLQALRFVDL